MENNSDERINNIEDFNEVEEDNSKKILSSNEDRSSFKKLNKDIRVYTMPDEFFNKKYQISRAKRLVESKKEQEIMEMKRISEEKKRMKRAEKENRKAEKEKRKRIRIEAVNSEKLKKEYEKRQALIEKNRKIQEEKLMKEKEREVRELKKKKELVLKDLEKKKLKEIKEEKKEKKNDILINEVEERENILNKSIESNENNIVKEKASVNVSQNKLKEKRGFRFIRKKGFEETFSNTIDGDLADSNINKNIDKKAIDSIGDISQKNNIKKSKKSESNFFFIFISIIIFVISVIITILITYRNGEWFYYEEEIETESGNSIYWNDLIEEDPMEDNNIISQEENDENKLVGDSENNNIEVNPGESTQKNENDDKNNIEDKNNNEEIIENESSNEEKEDFSYYYEKCDFFVTNSNFPASSDSDFDCLTDKEEIIYNTLNNNPDSDLDSYIDGMEVSYGYDPLSKGRIENNSNLKKYSDEINKFSFYYPKDFEFKTIDGRMFRIIPERDSEEYFEIEFLGSFNLSSLGRITKTDKVKQVEAWASDSSDYVYMELSNGDILRFYYHFSDTESLTYQASFSLIVRSVYIW